MTSAWLVLGALGACGPDVAQRAPQAGACLPAEEIPYDGVDQKCDGSDLVDVDGDGFPGGPDGSDCDDSDARDHPGATEIPYDGSDEACDGGDDCDLDGDGDGADIDGHPDSDCDDADPALNAHDGDADGYSTCSGDCDAADPALNPAMPRVCGNAVDDDCDGRGDCQLLGTYEVNDVASAIFRGGTAYGGETARADVGGPIDGTTTLDDAVSTRTLAPAVPYSPGMAAAGDVDVDGNGDLLVGLLLEEPATSTARTHLLYGPLAGSVDLDCDVVLETGQPGDHFAGVGALAAPQEGLRSSLMLRAPLGSDPLDPGLTEAGAAWIVDGIAGGW